MRAGSWRLQKLMGLCQVESAVLAGPAADGSGAER
jgi:hypothetical protein